MDVFSHAVAGAAAGAMFGHPVWGAVAAVVPDSALWLRPRLARPPALYRAAHGVLAPMFIACIVMAFAGPKLSAAVFFAWISHIILDVPTHGPVWSPRLFWPDERPVFTQFEEWEWFSRSWWAGLSITIMWSSLCLSIALLQSINTFHSM